MVGVNCKWGIKWGEVRERWYSRWLMTTQMKGKGMKVGDVKEGWWW